MISAQSSLVDVAFEVCTALDEIGVTAILVGGSAATYYAGAYQSRDIDFVVRFVSAVQFLRLETVPSTTP